MGSTVWKGQLSFGLVVMPVKLCCAARKESISFNQLRSSDLARVGSQSYCKADGAVLTTDQIVKGYEIEKDKFVVITPEEIKAAAPESSRTMEILEFVAASSIDPVYLETSYFLTPDGGGVKPYALLYRALQKTKKVGIARLVMSGNQEHVVCLRPGPRGLLLHTLFYSNEVRASDEYATDTSLVSDKELKLAESLVEALSAEGGYNPAQFTDSFRDNILALIATKKAGIAAPAAKKPPTKSQVSDLNDALAASLKAAKSKKRVA
jgi:DNA end-binding protein Ku